MNSDKQVKVNGGSALSYHAFVEALVKKFPRIEALMSTDGTYPMNMVKEEFNKLTEKLEFMHLAIGLATEGSEAADVIKQHAIYGKPFDRAALVKELGDLRFWIQDAQNKFMISDHEISQGNADKLGERYAKLTYSDKEAIARVDKKFRIVDADGVLLGGPFEHRYEAQRAATDYTRANNKAAFVWEPERAE
jgi:hypothetical protein